MPGRPSPTHFLCLPLVTPSSRQSLQTSLSRFAAEVCKTDENGKQQIPPLAIRPVGTLHFTIGVMHLQDSDRIQRACNFLKGLDILELLSNSSSPNRPILSSASPNQSLSSLLSREDQPAVLSEKGHPLKVSLKDLSPMHSPASTSSLYASPNPPDIIMPFAKRLHDAFTVSGFLLPSPSNRQLKLHATLVNTIYANKSAGSGKNRWAKGSGKIDAREVISKWGDTTWAEDITIEKVSICEMGAKRIKNGDGEIVDGVYTEVASISLP